MVRAHPGVRDVALVEVPPRSYLVVALTRFDTVEESLVALCELHRVTAEMVVVPFIARSRGTVEPSWLRRRLVAGTTLPDVSEIAPRVETSRLVLRRFCRDDLPAMRRLHRDHATMATLGGPLADDATSDRSVEWSDGRFQTPPMGHFAIERRDDRAVLGWVGFSPLDVGVDLPSDVQIGWRLHRDYWGRGYATEAARAVIDHYVAEGSVSRVVAITAVTNQRSRRLMERLGLVQLENREFDHPKVAVTSDLRRHVVYASEP